MTTARKRPIRADVRARADVAWNARVAGASWKQAAEIAGYTTSRSAIRVVQDVYGKLPMVDREEQRRLWRDRLEVVWVQALRDMRDQKPGAVTAAVRVATCAANLDGLNTTVNVNMHVTETFDTLLADISTNVYGITGNVVRGELA